MALQVSPISRNLALKVTVMFLEVEDMLALGFACAVVMLVGQFLFSDCYIFSILMNWFLVLVVLGPGIPALMLSNTASRGSILPIFFAWWRKPHQYCAHARDTKLVSNYLKETD